MIKIKADSKIMSDSGHDVVKVECHIDGQRDDLVREMYSILKSFENKEPDVLFLAIECIVNGVFDDEEN